MIRSRPGRAGYGYRFWFQHRLYERGGFPTRRAARSAEEIARARAGARRQSEATSVTLAEYATLWLAGLEGELARKTIRDYTDRLTHHVLPELGHLPLGSIERSHVTELLRAKRATYSRNSVRLIRAPLSSLLSDAADEGLIPVNPALGGRRSQRGHHLTPTDRLQRIRPMSLEQRDAFLRAAEGDPWAPLFELLAKTGARPGEAFALQVGDLDLEAGIARIERGWSLGAIVPTKTHHARRVDLSPRVARLLRVQRTEARTRALKEKWRGPLWLFSTEAGTPLDESKVRKRYKRLLRAAGLSGFRLYDLRHTYASLRLAGGAPLTYVAAQLGHSTPATTLRFYARWIPTEARTWVEQDRPERRPHAKTAAALRAAPARRRLSRGRDVETP